LVRVHPVVFHRVLDLIDAAGWQVQQGADTITVLVASPGAGFDSAGTAASVRVALAGVGARVPVTVSVVDSIPAGAAGKRPLVVNISDLVVLLAGIVLTAALGWYFAPAGPRRRNWLTGCYTATEATAETSGMPSARLALPEPSAPA
jgi:hypothetical protein